MTVTIELPLILYAVLGCLIGSLLLVWGAVAALGRHLERVLSQMQKRNEMIRECINDHKPKPPDGARFQ